MAEPSGEAAAPEVSPWWETLPAGTPTLLAFVRLELDELSGEAQQVLSPEQLRRRAQYTAGVEYVAREAGAAQPLHWQANGVTLYIRGDEQQSAVVRAFEAAELLRERFIIDLATQVRIALHAAVVAWNPQVAELAHPAIELCNRLAQLIPANGIAVTEDVYLSLPQEERQRFALLGTIADKGVVAYAFPASLAGRKDARAFTQSSELRHWEAFRRYASSPEIQRLRYVGFPLQKKQPPSLDIREVFIAPVAQVHRSQQPRLPAVTAARLLEIGRGLPQEMLQAAESLEAATAPVTPEPVTQLVTKHRALVLLGDPGSGKTTVLRWLAVMAAGGALAWAEHMGAVERLLPLLVSVGRLAEIRARQEKEISAVEALALYFQDRSVGGQQELRSFLEKTLEAGECLVLLDGLDEVRSEERSSLLRWLEEFCARYPRNRFIASSRQVGYAGFSLPDGVEAVLGSFTDDQVRRYVSAFESACRRWESNGAPDDLAAAREARKLLDAIFSNNRLRDLARNPFMLSALALIHRAEGQLPRHRVQAYEIFARTLCETWGSARRIVASEQTVRDIRYEEEAIPILGELALRMHQEWPTGVAPEAFVIKTLAEAMRSRVGVSPEEAEGAARKFLERAGRSVQILLERGAGQWGFLHLTFQEFFVAVGLLSAERFEEKAFQHLFDPRWEEILRLGVGYMALVQKRAQATQRFIQRVLEHQERGRSSFLTRFLRKQVYLAALLAGEVGDVLPLSNQQQIAQAVVEWNRVMPGSVVDILLHELSGNDFLERILDALLYEVQSQEERFRAKAVDALGKIGGNRAQRALLQCTNDPSYLVRSALCTALVGLKTSEALETLAVLARDSNHAIRCFALIALFHLDKVQLEKMMAFIIGKEQDPNAVLFLLNILHVLSGMFADVKNILEVALANKSKRIVMTVLQCTSAIIKKFNADLLLLTKDDKVLEPLAPKAGNGRRQADVHIVGLVKEDLFRTALLKATRDFVVTIRAAVISDLIKLRPPGLEKTLLRSLNDPDPEVRKSAIAGLSMLEPAATLGPLLKHAQKPLESDEKHAALELLWRLSSRLPPKPSPRGTGLIRSRTREGGRGQ